MLVTGVLLLLFVLLLIRVPVGFAIGIAGALGLYLHGGAPLLLGVFQTTPYTAVASHSLTAIPLFLLMAQFILRSGVADALFRTARTWVGRAPGGLGVATTTAGSLFAAISGSSTAAAGTLAATAIPEMTKQRYDPRLAGGLVAVVGTLAAMIPPSIILVFYAVLAEQSVGKVLIAGFLPGILVTLAIIVTTLLLIWRKPELAPAGERYSFREKFASLPASTPVLLLFLLVTGTIYFGFATPTEASALGAVGALLIGLVQRRLDLPKIKTAIREAISTSVMILMIIVSAYMFGYFLTATRVTQNLVERIAGLPIAPLAIFAVIALIYLVLGFFMDQMAILALTVPVVLPVIEELGFDPIWFGVVIVLLAEIGLVSPPLGLNVFVVARSIGRPTGQIFLGVLPFVIAILLLVVLFTLVPGIVLWLPETMAS
ncbi:tripartite ATP-independent transporter DctM subunit [Tamaricihabitans halophyticus]|uniref:Tripartite ATP-independent transporter DctM subunit n=1 Tax=Tamaricihabitans halophyticus TaxID=1262583 RepID=A0A4R2QT11_9PSEU|nr:TRAP transporter large permease [Tamaricihabitans halophyticus]TCP51858.1 tripartite ATP-independent transporter DctM subunit [Tamaricihabitans halophyticus]